MNYYHTSYIPSQQLNPVSPARVKLTSLVHGFVLQSILVSKIASRLSRQSSMVKKITTSLSMGTILSIILDVYNISNLWITVSVSIAQIISLYVSLFTQLSDIKSIETLSKALNSFANHAISELKRVRYSPYPEDFANSVQYLCEQHTQLIAATYNIENLKGYENELEEANEEAYRCMVWHFE